jgi:hypothetical protein
MEWRGLHNEKLHNLITCTLHQILLGFQVEVFWAVTPCSAVVEYPEGGGCT